MGYLHINNLYKDQIILMFKECYALEKIHGTSAHITMNAEASSITYFSGGETHEKFKKLFDEEKLKAGFVSTFGAPFHSEVTIYGEAYGGKQQGMSATYGPNLKFIVFDVKVGENWLDVANAHQVADRLGLEFVHYVRIPTDLASLDKERDADSVQAVRNGMGPGKKREGTVLRPIVEMVLNNGNRVICKHKGDDFKETSSPRKVVDPEKMKVLEETNAIVEEWVTFTRLQHVLDKLPGHTIERMGEIIKAMIEDVLREGKGELVESESLPKAISKKTAVLYKDYLKTELIKQNT